jgi:hypothetical protein
MEASICYIEVLSLLIMVIVHELRDAKPVLQTCEDTPESATLENEITHIISCIAHVNSLQSREGKAGWHCLLWRGTLSIATSALEF